MKWSLVFSLLLLWIESLVSFVFHREVQSRVQVSAASSVSPSGGISEVSNNKGNLSIIYSLTRSLTHSLTYSPKELMSKCLFVRISGVKRKEAMLPWQHSHF